MYFLSRTASTDRSNETSFETPFESPADAPHISRIAPDALADLLASQASVASSTVAEPTFSVDVLRTTDAIVVEAELRGIAKEDISVHFGDGVLRIDALRRRAHVVHEVKSRAQSHVPGALNARENALQIAAMKRVVAGQITRVRTSTSNRATEHLCRTLIMPASIRADGITAFMQDGLLTITLAYPAVAERRHSNAN